MRIQGAYRYRLAIAWARPTLRSLLLWFRAFVRVPAAAPPLTPAMPSQKMVCLQGSRALQAATAGAAWQRGAAAACRGAIPAGGAGRAVAASG